MITGSANPRQITGTFAITLSATFLLKWCHQKFWFPERFNVTHTSNHWSNEEKTRESLLKVIIPYLQKTRKNLQLHNI